MFVNSMLQKQPIRNSRKNAMEVVKESGSIGLQVHGGKNWQAGKRVLWKDLRIRNLSE